MTLQRCEPRLVLRVSVQDCGLRVSRAAGGGVHFYFKDTSCFRTVLLGAADTLGQFVSASLDFCYT